MTEGCATRGGVDLADAADRMFTSGFGRCITRKLTGVAGLSFTQHTNLVDERQAQARENPDDAFGVAITLGSQVSEVRHGRRLVRSGQLPRGCVTFSNPGDVIRAETPAKWDTLFVFLPCDLVRRVCDAADATLAEADLTFINGATARNDAVLDVARRAQLEAQCPGPFSRLRAEMLAQELVMHMLRFHSNASHKLGRARTAGALGGLAPRQLRRALEVMDAVPAQQITLDMLARAADCSATHFSRAFKQSTGRAPFVWLLNHRIERAKALLREPGNTLAEIALAVGFSAQPQFTVAFRRATGRTPGAWRREHEH